MDGRAGIRGRATVPPARSGPARRWPGRDLGGLLAEPSSEGPEVRLDRHVDQVARRPRTATPVTLAVEFVGRPGRAEFGGEFVPSRAPRSAPSPAAAASRCPTRPGRCGPGRRVGAPAPSGRRVRRRHQTARTGRGQSARCTDSGPSAANRSCHTRSVMNGVNGAMASVSSRRHSCRVLQRSGSPSQNRRRERRTYQLDRSSMNAASSRPATCESNRSRCSSTRRPSGVARDSAQRSIT